MKVCMQTIISGFGFVVQIMGFSPESVAAFIAVLGLLSIVAQVGMFLG